MSEGPHQSEKPAEEKSEVTQQEEQGPKNTVTIEDAGPCKKKITIEIPHESILKATDQQYKDLMKEATVPGFRKGRAPRRLLEKRFGKEATEQIKLKLLADASTAAVKDYNLKTLEEPDMTAEQVDKIVMPEESPMKFDFEIEVRPEFELPALEGIPVTEKTSEVTDEQVEEYITRMRKYAGLWTPRKSGVAELDDQIIADAVMKIEGVEQEEKLDNIEIYVRHGGFVGQVPVEDLDQLLIGAKADQVKETSVDIPKTYFKEEYRGKKIEIKITIKDIKELVPADLNEAFFTYTGAKDLEELQKQIRTRLQHQLEHQIKDESAEQIYSYLDNNTKFELPLDVVAKQAQTVLRRRYINLLMKGFQKEQIEQQLDQLKASSEEQAKQQLKTFFIIDKIAENFGIDVTDEEINGHIARLAIQEGQRPERLRQQMEHDGTLSQFGLQIRQDKCIAKLLETAKITKSQAAEKTEKTEEKHKKTAKKTKKTSKKAADTKEESEEKES
jgi:trigger factor